jgi:hypothetical protein
MQEVLMDQQVKMIESFGVNITIRCTRRWSRASAGRPTPLRSRWCSSFPIVAAICARIILGIWGMLMGGTGTFKQVYAILAHSGLITALQSSSRCRSATPRRLAGANLASSCRCSRRRVHRAVPRRHRPVLIWWSVNVAIGVGVLFKRKTGGIAGTFLGMYVHCPVLASSVGNWCKRVDRVSRRTRWQRLKAAYAVGGSRSGMTTGRRFSSRWRSARGGAVVGANIYYRRDRGVQVATEAIRARTSRPSCRPRARFSPSGR